MGSSEPKTDSITLYDVEFLGRPKGIAHLVSYTQPTTEAGFDILLKNIWPTRLLSWISTPERRLLLLASIFFGVVGCVVYAVNIEVWKYDRSNQMAYRSVQGVLVVRKMHPSSDAQSEERCPEVILFGVDAMICGWGQDANRKIVPLVLTKDERLALEAAYFWQHMRDLMWYPLKLASVVAVFVVSTLSFGMFVVGLFLAFGRISTWVKTGR